MALVNRSIPSLIGGVSQQPPSLRHPSQVEEMENCIPAPATGTRKRRGTVSMAEIDSMVEPTTAFIHEMDRGGPGTTAGRYTVVIEDGTLRVFDWDGVEGTVTFPQGVAYLEDPSPITAFRAVTVADMTIITNKNIEVATDAVTPVVVTPTLYHLVKVGVVDSDYSVTLNGVTFTYSIGNGAGVNKTTSISAGLATLINAGGVFTATRTENLLVITKTAGGDFTWSVSDSYGDQATFGWRDTVPKFEDLPAKFFEDVVIKIKGPGNDASGAWYVKWEKDSTGDDGKWVECAAQNIATVLDTQTMPHKLIHNSDGTWTFGDITWTNRLVGDDESNPLPSFVGETVNDVFFFRNRLGLLADENIILSGAGDYFDFFGQSARVVVDSDPIDKSASVTAVALLRHALPFDRSLLVFADSTQFQFGSQDLLSPKTAALAPTTAYDCSPLCRPVALGRNAYFITPKEETSAVREYYVDTNATVNDANDVTAHAPAYIPANVFKLVSAPAMDMVFALSTDSRNTLWVYNSFWNGDQKVQSAWHKWTFGAALPDTEELDDSTILSMYAFGTTLQLVIQRADGVFLESLELAHVRATSEGVFMPCLDRQVEIDGGTATYNDVIDYTYFTLPYTPTHEMQVVVHSVAGQENQVLEATHTGAGVIRARGDLTAGSVTAGEKYVQRVELSPLYLRDQKDQSIISGRLQLRNVTLALNNTGYFLARVTPQARDPYSYVFPAKPLGLAAMLVGRRLIVDGTFKFPVMSNNEQVTIELINDSALPSGFQSGEWEGVMSMTGARG